MAHKLVCPKCGGNEFEVLRPVTLQLSQNIRFTAPGEFEVTWQDEEIDDGCSDLGAMAGAFDEMTCVECCAILDPQTFQCVTD